MPPVGVLISGYHEEDAGRIQTLLNKLLATEVILIGGSGKAGMTIDDILRKGPEACFADEEAKILMFLGFSEDQTRAVLDGFPRDGALRRPIFCALTAQNRQWPLGELIDHLLEEHRKWTQRENQNA